MSVDDNLPRDHQSAVTGERQVDTVTLRCRPSTSSLLTILKWLNTVSWLTKLTTECSSCCGDSRQTTAPIDDGDLAAADQFTCNALDYKLLFTLNIETAMLNISILTEGKQCQKFNLLLTFVENCQNFNLLLILY